MGLLSFDLCSCTGLDWADFRCTLLMSPKNRTNHFHTRINCAYKIFDYTIHTSLVVLAQIFSSTYLHKVRDNKQ